MQFNVNAFKDVLKRSTLNFNIECVRLNITKDSIKSNMISGSRDAVTKIDIPNDVFNLNKSEEYEFNFSQPNTQLIPFLNLIDEDTAEVKVSDVKMILSSGKQKSNIHFCSPDIVSVFQGQIDESMEVFTTLPIDDDVINAFQKIKKVGSKFGNVYFSVEKNIFSVETTDKSNNYSNGLKFELHNVKYDDVSLKYDFKTFMDMLSVLNGRIEDFSMKFFYVDKMSLGMLRSYNEDKSEEYYLMSHRMEGEF